MNFSHFQTATSNDCLLQSGLIDIWQYRLDSFVPNAETLLNDDELLRARRYHFPKHQRRFTIARAVMRLILGRYLHLPPQALNFTYTSYGKPTVINTRALEFNLSHSEELALLAIGQGSPIGIDLEFFAARPYEGIGQHAFSSHENSILRQSNALQKPLTFFHIWSQKEAFIKACGLGLSYPTQQFDVPTSLPTHQIIQQHIIKPKTWQMTSFMPTIACCAALCYHPSVHTIRYNRLEEIPPIE